MRQVVITIARNVEHFNPEAIKTFKKAFRAGGKIDYVRRDPKNRREYEEICAELRPRAIIVPDHSLPFSFLPLITGIFVCMEMDEPPFMSVVDPRSAFHVHDPNQKDTEASEYVRENVP
ncbi:MAG TPA: hypothetical protein VMU07_02275 [Candidatus Paceibacterota bacterium]|nr:hypothetical protein [Candidatus Paceibacterota bacterium]